jgi:hydrogenase expression/formation protein HypD
MGYWQYKPLVEKYRVPIVVTGFEPVDILQGVRMIVAQLESGRASLENAYARAVNEAGNIPAQELLKTVFELTDRKWRGIGIIPDSGWQLSARYRDYDANLKFDVHKIHTQESAVCRSGEVLQGLIRPHECAAFGTLCTPRKPQGATMVSNEGACAAYYQFRPLETVEDMT